MPRRLRKSASDGRPVPCFSALGVRFATHHEIGSVPLHSEAQPAQLRIDVGSWAGGAVGPGDGPPVYRSRLLDPGGGSALSVFPRSGGFVLRFPSAGDFRLSRREVVVQRWEGALDEFLELRLLGPALAFWAENYNAVRTLHASAVAVGEHAVAFLADRRGGKTSLAAALMARGHPLMSDDIVALEVREGVAVAHHGYPQMRMWPAEAEHFLGATDRLRRVLPGAAKLRVPVGVGGLGSFLPGSRRLACVYAPERLASPYGTVEIEPIQPARAVAGMVANSFGIRLLTAVGLEGVRLRDLARLASLVPVRRLRFPSGLERLHEVAEVILDDIASM